MESLLSSCDCTVRDGKWAAVACSGTLYTYAKWRLRRRGKNKGWRGGERRDRAEGGVVWRKGEKGGKGFGGAYTTHWGKGVNFDRRAHG